MAKKKAPPSKHPLPAKRPPASKVPVPKDSLTGVTKADHTTSLRIAYFIRELGEFEDQVAELENNHFILKNQIVGKNGAFVDAPSELSKLKRQIEFLANEKKGLNDDCLELERIVTKLQEKLHAAKIPCDVEDCDDCATDEPAQCKDCDEDEDPERNTTTCAGCHNDFPDDEMMPADDKEGEYCKMCWKDGKAAA